MITSPYTGRDSLAEALGFGDELTSSALDRCVDLMTLSDMQDRLGRARSARPTNLAHAVETAFDLMFQGMATFRVKERDTRVWVLQRPSHRISTDLYAFLKDHDDVRRWS